MTALSNTEDVLIACKSVVDVGTDAHKWPDAMQKYFNSEEMKLTAQRGRHAVRVIDQCFGSHDKWQVRRILTFEVGSNINGNRS